MLYSNVPLNEIKTILLDYQSRTSVQLVKILAGEYWKINPGWAKGKEGYEKQISGTTAGVVIGDRALEFAGEYKYAYDLSAEWKMHTGLPFVFACWASNKKLPDYFLEKFNTAIRYGVENIDKSVAEWESNMKPGELKEYFEKYISYPFDERKKEAMEKFLRICEQFADVR
jgi:chorismate dehydratase